MGKQCLTKPNNSQGVCIIELTLWFALGDPTIEASLKSIMPGMFIKMFVQARFYIRKLREEIFLPQAKTVSWKRCNTVLLKRCGLSRA